MQIGIGMPTAQTSDEIKATVGHGLARLPSVTLRGYNAELRDGDQFLGDRATNRAFRAILDEWRTRLKKVGKDPLGDTPTSELSKKTLDKILVEGEPEAAGVILSALEEFASELVTIVDRFLKQKAWKDTERIVVGGGLRASRIGELAIGRASVALKANGRNVDLKPIHHHPDEAGLIGAVHLVPAWMFEGHDAILAVDIGGSNIRAGLVKVIVKKKGSVLADGEVAEFELWCYADDEAKPTRDGAVERIAEMLQRLSRRAEKDELKLAPFIGLACPGVIEADGHIERGGQNLPGNWESSRFNLPEQLRELLPKIGKHPTTVIMHNDAVVQGLSELPLIQDVAQWGVLTIGTGLGNAAFANNIEESRSSAANG